MRILYIRLENFASVKAAMGLDAVELDFAQTDKHIIQLYGKNRCGKTVMIQQLHPYSSINLNGDERSELSLVIPGKLGMKKIIYQVDDKIYEITHMYKPAGNNKTHTVSSSLICDGEELNPSGGVTVFNNTIEKIMGINKYTIQFIINGTQLTSIANMTDTQRKTLINKAMGIDIYDKIHKLSTDDYRYTSKLISSLNHTREYILQKYGSYDTLLHKLTDCKTQRDNKKQMADHMYAQMSELKGTIDTILSQDVSLELSQIDQSLQTYSSVTEQYGSYSDNAYDQAVNDQMNASSLLSELKSNRMLLMKDRDIAYEKQFNVTNERDSKERSIKELNELKLLSQDLQSKISDIEIDTDVHSSSAYLLGMSSIAQAVNGACNEIIKALGDKNLKLFCDMLIKEIDIGAFLMQENGVLNDSEHEKESLMRLRTVVNTVKGDMNENCQNECFYKNAYKMMENYFTSYIDVSNDKFTLYDLEQFEHAYKNITTIQRLIHTELTPEIEDMFDIRTIAQNMLQRKNGIDVEYLHHLMEQAALIETRVKYVERLHSVEESIAVMEKANVSSSEYDSVLKQVSQQISDISQQIQSVEQEITKTESLIHECDTKRLKLSQIKNINVQELLSQKSKLQSLNEKLEDSKAKYTELNLSYTECMMLIRGLDQELDILEKDNAQYLSTTKDIDQYMIEDSRYKIISEATSSTKGKPVVAIREKIDEALSMTNRLLDVMYGGEIRMLKPSINETEFTLPFRCGCNTSPDIRYGSQSESTLLSLALSLSLASSLNRYNISTVDELDAYLDTVYRDNFVLMLQEIMNTLHVEQLFLISHSILPEQYSHIIHEVNLSEIIMQQQ